MFNSITPELRRALGIFVASIILSVIVTLLSFVYMDGVYSDQNQQNAICVSGRQK